MSDTPRRSRLPWWVRWLHTYVSLLGFAALLFFSVTGVTLNHAEFFEGDAASESTVEVELPTDLVADVGRPVDRLAVVEHLRAEHGLRGAVTEFVEDGDVLDVVFKGPATSAEVRIDREDGRAEIYAVAFGSVALVDDLHKGRNSGTAWSWVIDASAVVLSISALTGGWLLLYVRRRRTAGVLVAVVGTVALVAVYAVWVP
ncbi:MAG: PepSY-associated TM helix domain-containing protein [Planctomycetota bacterium]